MRRSAHHFIVIAIALLIAACSGGNEGGVPDEYQVDVDWSAVANFDGPQMSWREDVQPIVDKRCVVCHGCFDAPCQLKLTSYEGLIRGANPEKVYRSTRINAAQPTRLHIDAQNESEWRDKGFHSVLATVPVDTEQEAAEFMRESVLYRLLRLKQLNPQPRTGLLPNQITTDINRKQTCTKQDKLADFEKKNPLWGMPYGMPNLPQAEYQTLVRWLAQGAQGPAPTVISPEIMTQVDEWDVFLNGPDNKDKLVSRYLYEHLFLGHLYFADADELNFFRLVRSSTPPGEPIVELTAVRPFDDPGATEFWYRLRHHDQTIVAKDHVIYELSPARMQRYRELFYSTDYTVTNLPGYQLPEGANPFKTFAAIPARARYKFMLDDARFFIQGFIKGPVCRGQVALNVIEDQFWVVFVNPDLETKADVDVELSRVTDYLQMPTKTKTFNLLAVYGEYWDLQKQYLAAKSEFRKNNWPSEPVDVLNLIWDGNGTNENAALTVFRNFDSAAVEFGLLGKNPETAWVVSFPLFERIHYLLVAGFDVYGNVGHQLNTRLFMDFLRMEGEDNFLSFMPTGARQEIRASWYEGIRSSRSKYFAEPMGWSTHDAVIKYQSDDPQSEFYSMIVAHLGPLAGGPDFLNRCSEGDCEMTVADAVELAADTSMRRLADMNGEKLIVFPEVAFVRVMFNDREDLNYSLILNRSWSNITSLLEDASSTEARDPEGDTMTVLSSFSGTYPGFYFAVKYEDLDAFVEHAISVQSIDDYHIFVARYGVRRTEIDFWEHADWFQAAFYREQPLEAGVLDLSRYENR